MKSKHSIRILIGLMSLALLGVMVIQFLWIKNAIHLKQEQFDHSVNVAMTHVSVDLENRYGVHFIAEQLEKDSTVRKQMQQSDPGFYKFMISVDDDKQKADVEVEPDDSTVGVNGNDEDTGPAWDNRRDSSNEVRININDGRNDQIVITKSVLMPQPARPADPGSPYAQIKTNLIKIVNNVADEYEMSKMNASGVYDVIDSQKIYNAIRKEFQRQGPQDFIFATYCTEGDTLIINKSCTGNPLDIYDYKSPLLATDFIKESTLLLINFPSRLRYIFSSLAGMLALSFFFTLTIILAFTYSLHVIFKQKKLSDITNDFINNMTHELKTPLATISMTADTLGLAAINNGSEKVNEYSGMIKNEVKKLSRHVDRILEAAVLERNGNSSQKEVISLNQLIEDEVKIFEPIVQQRNGKLGKELPSTTLNIYANKDLFRGAICNLLDNAVKYSKEVPEIKISLQKIGERALLSVADTGLGISKGDQKMIFEKFYRANTGNRHDVKGFGLGLSFLKTVVENAGGRVWVNSEPGKGSKFFVELPL